MIYFNNLSPKEFLRLNEANLSEEVKLIINELISLVDRYEDDYINDNYEDKQVLNY